MPPASPAIFPTLACARARAFAFPALFALGVTWATLAPALAVAGQGAKSNAAPGTTLGSPTNSTSPHAATAPRKARAADPGSTANRRGSATATPRSTAPRNQSSSLISTSTPAAPPTAPAAFAYRMGNLPNTPTGFGRSSWTPSGTNQTPSPSTPIPALTVSAPPASGPVRLVDTLEPANDPRLGLRNTDWDGKNTALIPFDGDSTPTAHGASNETDSAFQQLKLALDREDFLAVYGPLLLTDLDQQRSRFSSDTFLSEWQYSVALRSRTNYMLQALRPAPSR